MSFVVISPCRDEAAFALQTLESVDRQTRRPDRWIIVDDGSSDGTGEILSRFAATRPWIHVLRRTDRGHRAVGPGVVDAFYAGLESIAGLDVTYLCKLDLDLDLPPRYFEILLDRMASEPRLGTCSGKPYFRSPGAANLISEACGDENSVGMTKLYRRSCFDQIGGFVREVAWDGIDGHRCRMLGWLARSWDEPELRFLHLRPMGSSQQSIWIGRMRAGRGQWFMGTLPLYMLVGSLYRMSRPPLLIGGIGLLWGYLRAWWDGMQRYENPDFRRFLRAWQWRALVCGKRCATAAQERQRAGHWRPGVDPA